MNNENELNNNSLELEDNKEEIIETKNEEIIEDKNYVHLPWKTVNDFQEVTFYNHFIIPRKPTNLFWKYFFYINSTILLIILLISKPFSNSTYEEIGLPINNKELILVGFLCLLIASIICFFSWLFIAYKPKGFVKFAMIIILIFSIIIGGFLIILLSIYFLFFAIILLIVFILIVKSIYKRMNFTSSLLNSSSLVLSKFPSVFFLNFSLFLFQQGISYIFTSGFIISVAKDSSLLFYLYISLSYAWIIQTISFVTYTTIAGIASYYYFLNETEYEVENPILFSFKNAIGPTFGPCALAGLLEAITEAFAYLEEYGNVLTCGLQGAIFCICKVICCCCIACIDFLIGTINKYSLIYCAMFGLSAGEGVRRWSQISKKKLIDQVVNSSVIGLTFWFYAICSSGIASILANQISNLIFLNNFSAKYYLTLIAPLFSFNGFLLISKPLAVISDTLFIGLAEAPQRLERGAKEIFEIFDSESQILMTKEIQGEGEEIGKKCCC